MSNLNRYVPGLIFFLLICAIKGNPQDTAQHHKFPYDLGHPDEKHILPDILMEISGNVLLNDRIMICIQDEEGDLFFFDLYESRLIKRVDFGKDADYEDVTMAGDVVYVLRSNGTIYRLTRFDNEDDIHTVEIKTDLSKKNNCEGLAWDPVENRLLVALKGKPELDDDQDFDGYKAIYSFDTETRELSEEPAYLIELRQIKDLEKASLYERISHRIASQFEESDDIRFQPSAIAIHPITDEIYVLASVGKALVVMSRKGELLSVHHLNKWLFVQPEGMCFAPDGTLYISSEGDGGNGLLMKFKMEE